MGLIVAGVILIAVGEVVGRMELIALGIFLLALPLAALLTRLLARPRLDVRRSSDPGLARSGEAVRVLAEVRNAGVLTSRPMAYIDLATGHRAGAVGGVLPAIPGSLRRVADRRRERRISYALEGVDRGVHRFGPLYVDSVDGLGLTRRVLEIGDAIQVEVWPRTVDITDILPAPNGQQGDLGLGMMRTGDADDVITRDYRRGDAVRRIHWKSTARQGDLRVRQEEQRSDLAVAIIVDTHGRPDAVAEPGPPDVLDLFDGKAAEWQAPQRDPVFEGAMTLAASAIEHFHHERATSMLVTTAEPFDPPALEAAEPHERDVATGAVRTRPTDDIDDAMRLLTLAQPRPMSAEPDGAKTGDAADETSRIDPGTDRVSEAVRRIRQTGARVPIVFVHRQLTGPQLDRILALGDQAPVALCLHVEALTDDEHPDLERMRERGWQIVSAPVGAMPAGSGARGRAAAGAVA